MVYHHYPRYVMSEEPTIDRWFSHLNPPLWRFPSAIFDCQRTYSIRCCDFSMISHFSNFKVIIYDYHMHFFQCSPHLCYFTLGKLCNPLPNGLGWGNLQGPTNELADATLRKKCWVSCRFTGKIFKSHTQIIIYIYHLCVGFIYVFYP